MTGLLYQAMRKTILFDDYSTNPFVIEIMMIMQIHITMMMVETNLLKLDTGPYLVNVNATNPNDVTLTKIVADTDYDGIMNFQQYTL